MAFTIGTPHSIPQQRAMLFVDGTNLLYRLRGVKLQVPKLWDMLRCSSLLTGKEIVRIYFYSIQPHIEEAVKIHGKWFFEGVRVVLGDAIAKGDGNYKEKGVDALLVADLIYHAASRNLDAAILVSVDTDFCHAIKRVEDFGCRTSVLGICADPPERLEQSADRCAILNREAIRAASVGFDMP